MRHILIAEDNALDLQIFREAIKQACEPVKFTEVSNGLELLNILAEIETPDLILLDLNMPSMQGEDCLKVIRGRKKYDDVPIMVYSGSSSRQEIDYCLAHGANYYVVKPNSLESLQALANDICTGEYKSVIPEIGL